MFPNWFDDSEGAEEYSRNNPNSEHYSPELPDEEADDWPDDVESKMLGVDEPDDDETDFNSDDDEVFIDYLLDNYGDEALEPDDEGDEFEDEEYDPPDIYDDDFDPDDVDIDW